MGESDIKRIDPKEAFALLESNPRARLIDVRSKVEFDYVGHANGAIHVPWKEFPHWEENAGFVEALENSLGAAETPANDAPLLLICRSGVRSFAAAKHLSEHGYSLLYNVEEGFEGDKDDHDHRSTINGWRFHGLPWRQG